MMLNVVFLKLKRPCHSILRRSVMMMTGMNIISNLNILKEAGNLFLAEALDLIGFEARDIADTKAIESLSTFERIFKE